MAFNSIITHAYDLTSPLRITTLSHSLVSGDDMGDRFEVSVLSGGAPVPLTGGSVMGYFIREGDGATIPITGTASDNVASVVLPEACYAVTGRFSLVIKVSLGGTRHTIYACEGAVLRSMTDSIVDPGHNIPDLQELLALIDQMEQATTKANTATSNANAAAAGAEAATKQANAAAKEAEEQTARAQRAADEAEAARHVADRAADDALEAADKANSAADRVDAGVAAAEEALKKAGAAADRADEAVGLAQGAIKEAAGAAGRADAAAGAAASAAGIAEKAAGFIRGVTTSATTIEPGGQPEATVSEVDDHLHITFGLVQGERGEKGDKGDPGEIENLPYGTAPPRALGKATPGTSEHVSREDHVHPLPTAEEIGAMTKQDLRRIDVALDVSAWTEDEPYTATIERGDITGHTEIIACCFDGETAEHQLADIEWESSPGMLTLTTTIRPAGALNGYIVLGEVVCDE